MAAAVVAIVKPSDCVLGLALPASKAEFLADLARPEADFAKRFRYWGRYRREILPSLAKRCRQLSALGVTIVPALTLEGFGGLFHHRFAVVILFAHNAADRVELRDGFASAETMVERVPRNGAWALDLCVCHPSGLVHALRRDRPSCAIRSTNRQATPTLWLGFYYALMHRLYHEESTYLQALEMTIAQFQEE